MNKMGAFKNLTGERIGHLVVVEFLEFEQSKYGGRGKWLCQCDCGNEVVAYTTQLTRGTKRSCGCVDSAIGKRFGKLLVIDDAEPYIDSHGKKSSRVLCRCDCGTEKIIRKTNLVCGKTISCGCINVERLKNMPKYHKHNETKTRLYRKWACMKSRCTNPNDPSYKDYGGRGITVCDEWLNDFVSFRKWAYENGYTGETTANGMTVQTLDRIDVNGNYEPLNCRWATAKQQANNKRNNRLCELDGEVNTISEWCDIYNINHNTVRSRLHEGWDLKKALTMPIQAKSRGGD